MQSYRPTGLEKIHSTHKTYMKEYEHHLDGKTRMDMSVGRKLKNYNKIVGLEQNYNFEYAFVKGTQPIVQKNIKGKATNRNGHRSYKRLEKGTMDIEKLNLIKTHPNFKDIIGKQLYQKW